jgi:hypothetical protein
MRLVLVCLLPACVVGETSVESEAPPAETSAEGIVTAPRHGDVAGGDTRALTFDVAGTHSIADYRIDVQVLDHPNDPASWITIGTTLTASSSETGQYAWKLLVSPGRDAARRWPAGGVVRLRAVGAGGELLSVMFHDSEEIAPVTNGMILVSPSPTPAEAPVRARFLDRRSAVDAAETLEYYAAIDAPPTLADFQARFPMTTATTFYNAGDLGIGREMHCGAQAGGVVACYVSNYGTFGGDRSEALNAAVGRVGAFATVAMIYQPPASSPNSVRFVVYGANGQLVTEAQLDQYGDNVSIPNNCLNCHGGARYDAEANAVIGARFLPFDTSGFEFADLPGFRPAEQAANIRALNDLVATTEPTPAIRELIDGFAATSAEQFVPAGWSGAVEREVYKNVVAVACRSCHASLGGSFDFTSAAQFTNVRAAIADSLCGPSGNASAHDMPSAEIPLRRLWTTPARAYLIDYLDIKGACDP